MFVLQNEATENVELAGLAASPLYADTGTAKFDFTLSATESARGLDVSFEYATDLFDRATLLRLGERWRTMLTAVIATRGCGFPDPGGERGGAHQILSEWNDPTARRAGAGAGCTSRSRRG